MSDTAKFKTVSVDVRTHDVLKTLARQTGRTIADVVRCLACGITPNRLRWMAKRKQERT